VTVALALGVTAAGVAVAAAPQPPCAVPDALLAARETEQAREWYVKVLEQEPGEECASTGLSSINTPDESGSFFSGIWDAIGDTIDGIADWAPRVVIGVASIALVLLLLLFVCGLVNHGRWLVRLPLVGGLFAPRVSMKRFDDSGLGDLQLGAVMAGRVKVCLHANRDHALGETEDYDLDYGAGDEEFVNIVSETSALQEAIRAARDISDQSKPVAAILDVVYGLLPIRKISVEGSLDSGPEEVAVSLTLQDGSRQAAAVTLTAPKGPGEATTSDFARLVQPAALWIHYQAARLTSTKREQRLPRGGAKSYALLREGIDRQDEGNLVEAHRAYTQAIALDETNWAARVNLASLCARRLADKDTTARARGIALVEEALQEMGRSAQVAGSNDRGYLEDPNFFRLAYQLAAMRLNVAVGQTEPKPADLTRSLVSADYTARAARYVLSTYAEKRKRRRRLWLGLRHHTLSPKEERLQRFLAMTVKPAAEIVLAAAERELVPALPRPEALVRAIRTRADKSKGEGELGYRVYYNLACYDATRGDREQALTYLREALVRAKDRHRAELVESAKCDPALKPLRTPSKQWKTLLAHFTVAEAPKKPASNVDGATIGEASTGKEPTTPEPASVAAT
jgi:hypothetical protein